MKRKDLPLRKEDRGGGGGRRWNKSEAVKVESIQERQRKNGSLKEKHKVYIDDRKTADNWKDVANVMTAWKMETGKSRSCEQGKWRQVDRQKSKLFGTQRDKLNKIKKTGNISHTTNILAGCRALASLPPCVCHHWIRCGEKLSRERQVLLTSQTDKLVALLPTQPVNRPEATQCQCEITLTRLTNKSTVPLWAEKSASVRNMLIQASICWLSNFTAERN